MDSLFEDEPLTRAARRRPPGSQAGRGVADRTFPARVAALLRSRPISDAAAGAARQEWPAQTYDLPTLALAAIDLVIAQQGFEDEATYSDVVSGLAALARRAAPDRTAEEHTRVARYAVDQLLNRAQREAPFTYRISDYSAGGTEHQQRQVQFRLLVEREDPGRGEVVLNATGDAINALVGGLEFEVEDEQVANEILLERQLARGAFDAAERAAVRARLLSVSLADGLQTLIRQTRRDLRSVVQDWATTVPGSLDGARDHIKGRVDAEHRLLLKVRGTITSEDPDVAESSVRIAALLEESRRRHETLHRQVMEARTVFLEEQDRQAFRPPSTGHLPDLGPEVLTPMLRLPAEQATVLAADWIGAVAGPRVPRLPRLYRVVDDLWAVRTVEPEALGEPGEAEEAGALEMPLLRPAAIDTAVRAVGTVGLPARLSALIAACLADPAADAADRQLAAEITALAALWCFSPEDAQEALDALDARGGGGPRADLATRVLGPRAAADADDLRLALPGWDGDDLVVAPFADALESADPPPVTTLETVGTGAP